jgi:predicted ATPase
MKIIKLEIDGFRSIRSQTWSPDDLNVLIGPNASGKSNVLRVLEMLSVASRGGLGKLIQQEGGMDPLLWDGQAEQVKLRLKTTPADPSRAIERDALTYELVLTRLGRTSDYRIAFEMLGNFYRVEQGTSQEPFKLIERVASRGVLFDENEHSLVAPEASIPDDETLLSLVSGPFTQNRHLTTYQKELAGWKIYQGFQTHREAAIRSRQVTRAETQVSSDGQNLVSVLHSLYTSSRDFKNEINTAMKAAFGDDFEELVFPPAADQRIQLRIRWKSLTREQSAADLSDGTLRFLFLLAVLANPAPPPLIAIDEPEIGLHPSMLKIVAEYARDASSRSQVILTTHSPELLDAFGENAPTTTVVERLEGETKLRVISGEELSYWLKQYTLGDLFRSNELEAMR